MKIAFFGSPEFAVPTLDLLQAQKDLEIVLVVTQPDKPANRGLKLTPTAIKTKALALGLSVQETMPSVEALQALGVEKIVVIAYGKFIPANIVNGWPCINLHPSLLPKYRGPSPLQTALLNGDSVTGLSTMLLSEGMDDGDLLLQKELPLDPNTDIQTLHDICAVEGAVLILKTLQQDLQILRKAQDHQAATICQKIEKEDSEIKLGETPWQIHNKVRAITGYLVQNGKRVKILKTHYQDGALTILRVQPEGKPPMDYNDYKNGYGAINL